MSRMIFAIAALVSSYGFVFGEVSKSVLVAVKPLIDRYESCVVGRAKSFAGSPDSTESIIKDAMRACAPEKRTLSDALRPAGLSPDESTVFLSKLDRQVSQAASQAVLEERASH